MSQALAALLYQNKDKDPVNRIREALEAAEKHTTGARRPFYILNTKNDDIVEIK